MNDKTPLIRVFIVEAQPIMRDALTQIINSEADMTVVGMYRSIENNLSTAADAKPDIVLYNIPTHPQKVRQILGSIRHQTEKPVEMVMYCVQDSVDYVHAVLSMGVKAYMDTFGNPDELLSMIRSVINGAPFETDLMRKAASVPPVQLEKHLTPRQTEVLGYVAQGLTNDEIKELLNIQVSTVKKHVSGALEALGVDNRTEAGYRATRLGLLHDSPDTIFPDGGAGGGAGKPRKRGRGRSKKKSS